MTQKKGKRQPVYSADALALRFLAGIALIALGVMMLLAVAMRLSGNVFAVLRQTCFGLAGGLAVLLPALPIWAGVLVIWSSQRKAPVRPFLFAVLAFFSFKSDYNCQQTLMFSTMKGEETALSRAIESRDGKYSVNYDKLDEEYRKYFDKDKLSSKRSDQGQSQQEFIIALLEDKSIYSPISTKTTVLGVISVGLLVWLILRSLRQIRALY